MLIQFLPPQYKSNMDMLERLQLRAKMLKGLEHTSCEGRLRELGLFGLVKRRLRGILVMCKKYLKREHMGGRACISSVLNSDRTGRHGTN